MFTAPAFLWTALALLPLIAIYFLKVRPRRQPTTALFLWSALLTQRQTARLFQRLRHLWSLLLMAAALLLLSLALAGPRPPGADHRDLLLVIDTSASMGASDGGSTRLARAAAAAQELILALDGDRRAALATLDDALHYRCHLTGSQRELLAALDRISIGYGGFDVRQLADLALADGAWRSRYRTILISDGSSLAGQHLDEGVEVLTIADAARNVGIIAADLQRRDDGRVALFYRLHSTHDAPVTRELRLSHGQADGVRRLIPVTLQPGLNPAETFLLDEAEPGAWFLSFDQGDAFPVDDTAYLALPPRRPVPVGVAAAAPYFLARCVQAIAARGDLLMPVEVGAELILAHSLVPETARAVILQPEGASPWWSELGAPLTDTLPVATVADHPLLAHLDPERLDVTGARQLRAPAGAEIVVHDAHTGTPLLYRVRHEGRQAVVANLDPLASDFYLAMSFPVLVHDAARLLIGRSTAVPGTWRVGHPIPIDAAVQEVRGPDDSLLAITRQGERAWITPPQPGHLRLQFAERSEVLGASVIDTQESALTAAADAAPPPDLPRGTPWASWLIAAALLLLVGECLLYHRRLVG